MAERILRKIRQHRAAFIILFLAGMGILYHVPPFLMDGIPHYTYEDTWFHLSRVIGLRNVWLSPVNFLNFAQNGPMVNIFYPWLTMYPMYLLFLLTGSYVLAYKIFYLALTLFTLAAAFSVMRHISKDDTASLVFAVLYTFSAYRFANLFRRAHLGEAICMTALLFVLCGLYDIAFGDRRRWGPLAVGMAMIAYSHNIALLIASLVTGLFVLIAAGFADDRKERFLSFCKGAGTAVLFALGSFVSILYYTRTNEIYTPGGSGQGLQDSAYSLGRIILSSLTNEPVSFAVGFWVILAIAGLAVYYIRGAAAGDLRKGDRGIDCFAVLGILLFLGASSLLPWKWLGDHTPLYLFQFVWRLNAHTTIFLLAPFSYYLPKMLRGGRAKTAALILISVLAVGLHYSAVLRLYREDHTRIFEADAASGSAVMFDYGPLQAKQYRNEHGYAMDEVLIGGAPVPAETVISADGSVLTLTLDAPEAEGELAADVPVFWYRQQRCTVNGGPAETAMSERGASLVPLRPGERNEIRISYRHSILTYLSWALSALTLMVFLLRRKKV